MRSKVILIGWDGASWPAVLHYLDQGQLPTLQGLLNRGVAADLQSTIPFHSGPAWTSIVTGVNPGKHNIFHFCRTNGYEMEVTNGSFRRSKPIWHIASQAGKTIAVVNIPMTYPPERVHGVMVSGMDTPSEGKRFTYPDELREELLRSGYLITWGSRQFEGGKGEAGFVARLLEMATKRGELVLSLMERLDPDVLIVNFAASDRAQHFFWHRIGDPSMDPVGDVYRKLDHILSQILQACGNSTTVLLVSDHGFGPLHRTLAVGNWLRNEGYLHLRWRVPKYVLRKAGTAVERAGGRPLLRLLNGLVPLLGRKLETAKIDAWSPDWSKTRVWFPPTSGGIRINVKGREPRGIVERGDEYEKLRDEIAEKLEALVDPSTGVPAVKKVHRREVLYSGPYVDNAPDLILEPSEGYRLWKTARRLFMDYSGESPQTGEHTQSGIFVAHGPGVQQGARLEHATVYDLVPTMLHVLGLPVHDDMDGRVLSEMFEPASEPAQRPVVYTRSGLERDRIREKLKRLRP